MDHNHGASLRLVNLDACRNNPLTRSMQRMAASRIVSGGSFGNVNEDLLRDDTLGGVGGGDDGERRTGSEQRVHVCVAGACGATTGGRGRTGTQG